MVPADSIPPSDLLLQFLFLEIQHPGEIVVGIGRHEVDPVGCLIGTAGIKLEPMVGCVRETFPQGFPDSGRFRQVGQRGIDRHFEEHALATRAGQFIDKSGKPFHPLRQIRAIRRAVEVGAVRFHHIF